MKVKTYLNSIDGMVVEKEFQIIYKHPTLASDTLIEQREQCIKSYKLNGDYFAGTVITLPSSNCH